MPKGKRKKQRRPKRTRAKSTSRAIPPKLYEGLVEAERLDRQRKWDEARRLLEQLDRQYPHRAEVWSALLNVYHDLGDIASHEFACRRLVSLQPDDPDLRLMLAGSCMENCHPALALRSFRYFLEHWPDDERADEVSKTAAVLGIHMEEILRDLALSEDEGLRLAALHEEVLCCLHQGEFADARRLAEQLRWRHPEFLPAINNLAELDFREGRTDQAVAAAHRVLRQDPNNYHALANLTRYLGLSGRAQEARPWADRLKAAQATDPDLWLKKAETFSVLGDDPAVLQAYQQARENAPPQTEPVPALLSHLAAVAAMRLGQENDARRYWTDALRLDPGLGVAQANLQDLKKPPGERHAPWAFGLDYWVPRCLVEKLLGRTQRAQRRGSEQAVAREARRFLLDHPQLAAMLPVLLDRSDRAGREFALTLAKLVATPEALDALRDFALGQRGPDRLRQQAGETLREAAALPAGPVRMWIKGRWEEILMCNFEIHRETRRVHQPHVEDLASQASAALYHDDPQEAERLLQQALQVEPDAIDLLNNLAAAYRLQGRWQQWQRLVEQIHQRDPDYFFGRVNMAFRHLQEGDFDAAREMLSPLMLRQRLHLTEFTALCQAEIEICLAEGQRDAAQSWLRMWEEIEPDHPDLRDFQRECGGGRLWDLISGLRRR
jgi:tetratricopeptide (TPR) repeat protein